MITKCPRTEQPCSNEKCGLTTAICDPEYLAILNKNYELISYGEFLGRITNSTANIPDSILNREQNSQVKAE